MRRILVIDDDEQMLRIVGRALASDGYEVDTAATAREGLAQIESRTPDLIISDVRMDGQDGFELLATLRQDARTAAIPVIMITGLAERQDMRRAMDLGADDFLTKPFSPEELRQAVASRLRKQSAMATKADERLVELRRSLSSTLSHELRTPLNAVLGYAELLLEAADGLSPGEIVEIGTAIQGAGKRLGKLVDNYLAYAETELLLSDEGRLAESRRARTKDLSAIVACRALELAAACGRTDDLHMDMVAAPAAIHVDHARKIAEELMANAFAFSTPGSPVSTRICLDETSLRLEIEDQGRGMTSDEIATVGAWVQFGRRFYEQQGSGLGLAIARRLAEVYGGSLAVQSEKARGTTVTVTLPRIPG